MNISKNIGYKDYLTYTDSQKYNILIKREEEIERLINELKLYKDNHEHLNNLLQQKENIIKELKEDITFCINNMKNEYSCTDSRTNRELHTMVKILEESLDKGE